MASLLFSPPHLWLTDSGPPVVMLVKPIKASNHLLLFRCSTVCTYQTDWGRGSAVSLHTHTHTQALAAHTWVFLKQKVFFGLEKIKYLRTLTVFQSRPHAHAGCLTMLSSRQTERWRFNLPAYRHIGQSETWKEVDYCKILNNNCNSGAAEGGFMCVDWQWNWVCSGYLEYKVNKMQERAIWPLFPQCSLSRHV